MPNPHQTMLPPALDTQPRPSDREIYRKPVSLVHQERPIREEPVKETMP